MASTSEKQVEEHRRALLGGMRANAYPFSSYWGVKILSRVYMIDRRGKMRSKDSV